jgi:hypothetical protein
MMPVGRMIVLRNTEKTELLHATALITWPALTAPVVGPVIGGFITTYISWRWNFLLNVPLGIAGIWMVLRHVPKLLAEHKNQIDWRGFIFSACALIALLYSLDLISHAQSNWDVAEWLAPMLLTLVGVIFGWLSVAHFNRSPQPLLELSALSVLTYRISTLTAGTGLRTALHATPFLLPLMFQIGFGMNALASGSLLLVYFAGNLGIKPATTPMLRHFGFRNVLVINGCFAGIAIMLCSLFAASTPHWLIMAMLLLTGATRSIQLTCLNTLAFADTTPAQRTSSATLFSVFNQVAGVLGVALSTLVLNFALLDKPQAQAGLSEIRLGLVVMGVVAIMASLAFIKLPKDAGAEVSGHQSKSG